MHTWGQLYTPLADHRVETGVETTGSGPNLMKVQQCLSQPL